MLSATQIEQILSDIQSNPLVFSQRVNNVPIWCIIKRPLFRALMKNSAYNSNASIDLFKRSSYMVKSLFGLFQLLGYLLINLLNKNAVSLFFLQSSRRFLHDKVYFEAYIDGLFIEKGKQLNALGIDNLKSSRSLHPYSRSVHIIENFLKFPDIIFKYRKKRKNEIDNLLDSLFNTIKQTHHGFANDYLKEALFSNYIKKRIGNFIVEEKRSNIFLKLLKPSFIILVSSEGHLAMIASAKKLKIPVIEQQHGIISTHHPIYDWPKYVRTQKTPLCTPDYIFTFGSYWNSVLLKTGYWSNEQLFSSGSFKFTLKTKDFIEKKPDYRFTLLYSANESLKDFELSFFTEFLEMVENNNYNINVIVKLHPTTKSKLIWQDLTTKYKDLVVVYLGNEIDIYDLYSKVDGHLSSFSAAIFESLELKIITFTFERYNTSNAIALAKEGILNSIQSAEDLIGIITNYDELMVRKKILLNKQHVFFEEYSSTKQYNYINNIIK